MQPFKLFLLGLLLIAGSGNAQEPSPAGLLAVRYAKGSIISVQAAERALIEAADARARLDARFRAEEQGCYQSFFVAACLDSAREQHRSGRLQLREIELEASAFKRHARAAERELATQQRRAEASPSPERGDDERRLRHEAKLKTQEDETLRREQQRDQNIAAYERKQREAIQRQQEAAKRKSEKQQQEAKKSQQ